MYATNVVVAGFLGYPGSAQINSLTWLGLSYKTSQYCDIMQTPDSIWDYIVVAAVRKKTRHKCYSNVEIGVNNQVFSCSM